MQRFAATAGTCVNSRDQGADRAKVYYRRLSPVRRVPLTSCHYSFMKDYTALRAYSIVRCGRYVASEHRIR
jgi:hypothetical protein